LGRYSGSGVVGLASLIAWQTQGQVEDLPHCVSAEYSPALGRVAAMAYVRVQFAKPGAELYWAEFLIAGRPKGRSKTCPTRSAQNILRGWVA
jgi:glycine cleavage system aminomethyltransferase T